MRRWILAYGAGCVGLVGFVCFLMWAGNDFQGLPISWQGMLAIILGSALTAALSIGLMAAVFWSNRGGHDETAYRTRRQDETR
jgi:hypothetical protein